MGLLSLLQLFLPKPIMSPTPPITPMPHPISRARQLWPPSQWRWQSWSEHLWLRQGRALCYIEWFLIGVQLLLGFLNGAYTYTTVSTVQAIVYMIAFAVLSYFMPLRGKLWQRRLYVFINLTLLVSTTLTISLLPFDLTFFWGIIKTCFLLELPEVIIALVLTGIAYALGTAYSLPQFYRMVEERGLDSFLTPTSIILNSFSSYLSGCVFSVLLSGMLLSERYSRKRAEALAKEVETLSVNLERARIARDLHDSLGHHLTTLAVQLEVAQKLRQPSPEQALQALDTAKHLADHCLQAVRQSVHMLRPTEFNFDAALAALFAQIRQVQTFTLQTEIDLPPLPTRLQYQIYCMIQEGFTNIQKHAQASKVELRAWSTPEQIRLQLRDNGQGFIPEQVQAGFGLQILRERVTALAGGLILVSAPQQGTQIVITLPR
jgi:signal transduction histidine kinase